MWEQYASQIDEIIPEFIVAEDLTINKSFIKKAKAVIDKYLDKSDFDVEKLSFY